MLYPLEAGDAKNRDLVGSAAPHYVLLPTAEKFKYMQFFMVGLI